MWIHFKKKIKMAAQRYLTQKLERKKGDFKFRNVKCLYVGCACGCGIKIESSDNRGRTRRYIQGHNHRGKSNWWKIKENVKERTSHERASKICPKNNCFINNEQCSKRLEIAHKDGNVFNNNPDNLVCLCGSHHRLMDFGGISFEKLHELRPYIVSSGIRRYKK